MGIALTPADDTRFIRLCGTCNARDLGGLPLAAGGSTRRGVLYRADAPLYLDASDAELLARLGVTTVVDLREPGEVTRQPNVLAAADGVEVYDVDLWAPLRRAGADERDPWDLGRLYTAVLDHGASGFARAVAKLAAARGAALFHCTAGKDRTGLLAGLILESVGVPRSAIVDDYVLTHDRIESVRTRLLDDGEARGIRREDFVRLLGATPDLLRSALEHLEHRHGGATAYLRRGGVDPTLLERLRQRLVG